MQLDLALPVGRSAWAPGGGTLTSWALLPPGSPGLYRVEAHTLECFHAPPPTVHRLNPWCGGRPEVTLTPLVLRTPHQCPTLTVETDGATATFGQFRGVEPIRTERGIVFEFACFDYGGPPGTQFTGPLCVVRFQFDPHPGAEAAPVETPRAVEENQVFGADRAERLLELLST